MTIAMMGPLAVAGVGTTAFTSPWWRAGRAAGEFFAPFGLTWIVIALCLAAFAEAWTGWLGSARPPELPCWSRCARRPGSTPVGPTE
jgi:hypothetical protein